LAPVAAPVALITGASRGIGRACAEAFAKDGFQLALCASQSVPELPAGAVGFGARCDISSASDVETFFVETSNRLGPIDVLVLNAGVLERAPIQSLTEQQWDRVLDVNLKGAFLCARAAWPSMLARSAGRVIAIGSISGTLGTAQATAYNASKWGLTGFIKSLAEEGRAAKIFCASVLPGSVDTEMLRKTPWPPQMSAEEIARVVLFLATQAPFAMTGSAVESFG
jgi:3-oxoacyl-[acyl-carrier protein] reductase